MPEDPVKELRELVDSLSDWLRYQRRLGWRGVPRPVEPQIADRKEPADKILSLEEIRAEMGDCRRCKLYAGRTHLVFGDEDPNARLMFVGEAPGADEDRQGGVRHQKCRKRPAAPAPHERLVRELVDAIEVGPLFAVDFDIDEHAVHELRSRRVLEAFVCHDMAPVTGRVADRQQDRLTARTGERK